MLSREFIQNITVVKYPLFSFFIFSICGGSSHGSIIHHSNVNLGVHSLTERVTPVPETSDIEV